MTSVPDDWRRIAAEAKASMRLDPGNRAGALASFSERMGREAGEIAQLVGRFESLERHRRMAGMGRIEVDCTPEAAESLKRLEALAPMRTMSMLAAALAGTIGQADLATAERRARILDAQVEGAAEAPLGAIVRACMAHQPGFAEATVSSSGLSPAATLLGVDAEVDFPGGRGSVGAGTTEAMFASPHCRAARMTGAKFADTLLRVCAATALYRAVHVYVLTAGELEEVEAIERARRTAGTRIVATMARPLDHVRSSNPRGGVSKGSPRHSGLQSAR